MDELVCPPFGNPGVPLTTILYINRKKPKDKKICAHPGASPRYVHRAQPTSITIEIISWISIYEI